MSYFIFSFFFSVLIGLFPDDGPSDQTMVTVAVTIACFLSAIALTRSVTVAVRYFQLQEYERVTSNFLYITMLYFYREYLLITRRWRSLLFHFVQLMFGGVFIGLFYYDSPFKGPLIELGPAKDPWNYTPPADRPYYRPLCPYDLLSKGGIMRTICFMFQVNENESLLPIASLSVLTLSLCAASFAIPVFGREVTIFQRESGSGASTGSYMMGKSILYFFVSLIATLLFMLCFCGLVILKASWMRHFFLLLMSYLSWFGVGIVVSLLVPQLVSQLVAIFLVLGMEFSFSFFFLMVHCSIC
jgi:hypothetical protein